MIWKRAHSMHLNRVWEEPTAFLHMAVKKLYTGRPWLLLTFVTCPTIMAAQPELTIQIWNTKKITHCSPTKRLDFFTQFNPSLSIYPVLLSKNFSYLVIGSYALEYSIVIFRQQKRVIRNMCGVGRDTSCKKLFKECRLLTITSLYIYWRCYVL